MIRQILSRQKCHSSTEDWHSHHDLSQNYQRYFRNYQDNFSAYYLGSGLLFLVWGLLFITNRDGPGFFHAPTTDVVNCLLCSQYEPLVVQSPDSHPALSFSWHWQSFPLFALAPSCWRLSENWLDLLTFSRPVFAALLFWAEQVE